MVTINPADIQNHLAGVTYPARKIDLIDTAREKGASDDLLGALEAVEDREYTSPADLTEAMGTTQSA